MSFDTYHIILALIGISYRNYNYIGIGTDINSSSEPNINSNDNNASDSKPGDNMKDNPGDADKHGNTAAYIKKLFVTEYDQLFIEIRIMYVQVFPDFIHFSDPLWPCH